MNKVKLYDFKTQKVTEIPASELAPGMVQADVAGVGVVWIDADSSGINTDTPFRHAPFDAEKREIMLEIKSILDEVRPMTVEQWEEGFRRDENMEREIGLWCRIAFKFAHLTKDGDLSRQQKLDYFRLLLACVNGPREHVLETAMPTTISKARALKAIDYFFTEEE